jgi:adenine/guanine phosphoribosyltransferase-like PRPP-binding protein
MSNRLEMFLRGEVPPGMSPERAALNTRYYRQRELAKTRRGPGTTLLEVAGELGTRKLGCGCNRLAETMDAWGVAGCQQHEAAILAALAECAAHARRMVPRPSWFDPDDGAASILREALERSHQAAQPADQRPAFITTEQLVADTYRLAAKLPPDLAGVVGISRSGILPANLLAQHFHLPMWILRQDDNSSQRKDWGKGDVMPCGNGWRLHTRAAKRGPILVLDDTQMTGRSVRRARPIAEAWALKHRHALLWGAIYQNPLIRSCDRVEYVARQLPRPHFLEWNLFNSIHVASAAFDIDGVLCDERPGAHPALYPVRIRPMPLVVTGRQERHRAATLAWMAKWGMRCERLEMWQGTEAERDRPKAVSRFKARHFVDSGLLYFVESCPIQAREIAEYSGKPVICPAAGRVF